MTDPDPARVVHYQPPPSACDQLTTTGELWTGNIDRVTCHGCIRAESRAEEHRRNRPLMDALLTLYHTIWEETATVDIGVGGYNGLSYNDSNLIDAAGEAVERLLATGEFADLLGGDGD